MTDAQETHLARVKDRFNQLVDAKYRSGAREHGGDLLGMPALYLVDNSINEAVDMLVYLLRLRDQLLEVGDRLTNAIRLNSGGL